MKPIARFLCATALLAAPVQAAPFADPYTSLFVLGDSYSDEGQTLPQRVWAELTDGAPYYDVVEPNLFGRLEATDPAPALAPGAEPSAAPEAGGTYTNGFPWSRVLGDAFLFDDKAYFNVATFGAMGSSRLEDPARRSFFGTAEDQTGFVVEIAVEAPEEIIGLRPLVASWFGMEDMIVLIDDFAFERDRSFVLAPAGAVAGPIHDLRREFELVSEIVSDIVDNIFDMVTEGDGLLRDFLILDLPIMGLMPRYWELESNEVDDFVEEMTRFFNSELRAALSEMESFVSDVLGITDLNITVFDVEEAIFEGFFVLDQYEDLGPCITRDGAYPPFMDPRLSPVHGPDPTEVRDFACVDPTEFVFLDDVHMEAGMHEYLGRQAAASVGVTPVPLPAGAWLLVGGVGLLALRRKRAA